MYLSQIFLIALHFLLWKEKPNNDLNEESFLLYETTKRETLVFLTKKTSNPQRKKRSEKHETWRILFNEQREPKPPKFLLGKIRSTLKLSIHVLAEKEIENNNLFLD